MPRIKKTTKLVGFDSSLIEVGRVVMVRNFGIEDDGWCADRDNAKYKDFCKGRIISIDNSSNTRWDFVVEFDSSDIDTGSCVGESCWICSHSEMPEEDFQFEVKI